MLENLKKTDLGWIDKDDCFWDTKLKYIQCEILDFCGCGNPDSVTEYVIEMLEIFEKGKYPGYDNLPYMFFCYWADHKGFAEHSRTARCS